MLFTFPIFKQERKTPVCMAQGRYIRSFPLYHQTVRKEGCTLKLKRDKVNELQQIYFNGNNSKFAEAIGINHTYLQLFLSTGIGDCRILIVSIYKFCKEKELNFVDYVEI
jgi:hypothetical protein